MQKYEVNSLHELGPDVPRHEDGVPVDDDMFVYRANEVDARIADDDRLLRASVPERWKGCASPIGAVQAYIAELEKALILLATNYGQIGDDKDIDTLVNSLMER